MAVRIQSPWWGLAIAIGIGLGLGIASVELIAALLHHREGLAECQAKVRERESAVRLLRWSLQEAHAKPSPPSSATAEMTLTSCQNELEICTNDLAECSSILEACTDCP